MSVFLYLYITVKCIILHLNCYFHISEEGEGRPPISVKFEIPYFTTSGIQVRIVSCKFICCCLIFCKHTLWTCPSHCVIDFFLILHTQLLSILVMVSLTLCHHQQNYTIQDGQYLIVYQCTSVNISLMKQPLFICEGGSRETRYFLWQLLEKIKLWFLTMKDSKVFLCSK